MPSRSSTGRNRRPTVRGYARLEQRLALLAWLHQQLGFTNTADLLTAVKPTDEGFDPEGHSHIYALLASRSGQLRDVTTEGLQRYDDNIREHLVAMNEARTEPITLRYFQYLAALYAEIYLDRYCSNPEALLRSLNKFVEDHNRSSARDPRYQGFAASDLGKMAFWMATGSGKTLLLHLNYRQFLHYHRKPLDNILLITPNEGLSQQHIEELWVSNIAAERFDLNQRAAWLDGAETVQVTEITKLVMEKRGEGDSIPVEAFEGHNLIFVDEGHKGSGGEAWRAVRDALGATGFTFEYSATFGQALAAAKDETLLSEYGKAIAFDYSYRHFHGDGYGKDFRILNLKDDDASEWSDTLLLANLLSFYEQQLVFAEHADKLRPYKLERPLWAFIGGSVNAVYQKKGRKRSDVLTVVRFLHLVLSNPEWAIDTLQRLLSGESGLRSQDSGRDLFADGFDYVLLRGWDATAVYQDVLAKVMHTRSSSGLRICDLRGSEGELGLRAAGSDTYFGVINIGDTGAFKKLVEADGAGIVVEIDALNSSLFDRINQPDSTVEVLVGSRKFNEGWNSWRVSNMGLLNIGRGEGSQIIQLFGRGVRLRGLDMSLQRSSALPGEHPDWIRVLETLNIFAVRADYMEQFRDYLESEGIDTPAVELPLPIRLNDDFLNRGLVVPRLDEGSDFLTEETVLLEHSDAVPMPVAVDMAATVEHLSSSESQGVQATAGKEGTIPPQSLNLVDWNQVYLALLRHKDEKGLGNLLIRPGKLRDILEAEPPVYRLNAEESLLRPENQAACARLQEAVVNILRKYADTLHRRRHGQWESSRLIYKTLDGSEGNFRFNRGESDHSSRYIVKIPRQNPELAGEVENLIADFNALYEEDKGRLPRIHFDRHLYQPLLLERDGVTSSPPGLNESERRFVTDLKDYCSDQSNVLPKGAELFLLRNLGRGHGVGFFEESGFYPDFILWIKGATTQRIVFVDPHGMHHAKSYVHDDKARLHEQLPALARVVSERSQMSNVSMDSFIVSATPFDKLRSEYGDGSWERTDFTEKHILFFERNGEYDYIKQILRN
ncbi:MAG: DEAD/DEAH box helicase family protein [Caldilineaceae bacterium]|nr:DEAD/DEAH box helicase family protein [Caldilineaceae bacterium]